MASHEQSLLEFFSRVSNQGGIIVTETPKLDIDLYICNYKDRTRFDRLLFIGQTSVTLCVEALKAAILEAKSGRDVGRYREAWDCIRIAAPSEPEATFDAAWVARTEKSNKEYLAHAENNLARYKHNLVKDSIRMGHEELGRFNESIGNLEQALEAYSRMRPDVSTAKHIVDIGRHLIRVAIQRRDWNAALTSVSKLSLSDSGSEEDHALQTHADVVRGVASLGQYQYAEAAAAFLRVDPLSATASDIWGDIASVNDVAVYGGLLALATMSRDVLQKRVLENQGFRIFLEGESQLRKAVSMFVNGRYATCLQILESYRSDWLLDLHLSRHVPALIASIRTKCIVEYVQPFSSVTMETLDQTFGMTGGSVLEELKQLIRNGMLNCRLDMMNRVLLNLTPTVRTNVHLKTSSKFAKKEQEAKTRLYHMSITVKRLESHQPTVPESAFGRHVVPNQNTNFI